MTAIDDTKTFTMPLPQTAHRLAQEFCQHHTDSTVAKRVYLNTLATYAVKSYLEYFGIETNLELSDEWNPVFQALADTGALHIEQKGILECRPMLPEATACHIPADIQSNRVGYVAVQLNSSLDEAILLGFTPTVNSDNLAINDLQPIDNLLDYVEPLPSAQSLALTRLSDWLQGVMTTGWQTFDELMIQPQPALSFRHAPVSMTQHLSMQDDANVSRGQIIEIELLDATIRLALAVGVKPESETSVQVWVMIFALDNVLQLPSDLDLMILDDADNVVMHAQARETESIELKFGGDIGDRFDIKVVLGEQAVTRAFVI